VLLVDFDELPAKAAEALPVVRFRLKKLLPFDADDAAVSYQIMAQTRSVTQVLAVAMPRELLAEYEAMVREAGYEPGAVLPSTLAVLAGLEEDAVPALVVNAGRDSVTTAIVKDGLLLLHRTIDLTAGDLTAGDLGAGEAVTAVVGSAGAVEVAKGAAVASVNAATSPASGNERDEVSREASQDVTIAAIAARFAAMEGQTTPAPRAPDGPQLSRMGSALASAASVQAGAGMPSATDLQTASFPAASGRAGVEQDEIAQAVSVAAAYFEDTLEMAPPTILSAGTLGADALARLLSGAGAPRVQEMVSGGQTGGVPAGWLAGVRGALRS
jgi:type IV pilus assembly protein PilM